MDIPFFTVIIPTHNRLNLLRRSVESVISQTFDDFELIIVDDNSTDNTKIVVDQFTDNRIIYKQNIRSKGPCGARNTGIYEAKGKWIAFLDDDDVWLPEKLEHQYAIIKKSKNSVGLVCCDYAIYKGKNRKVKIIQNRPKGWLKDRILFGYHIGCLSSTCVKTDILKFINGFDENFPSCQDQDLWFRVAAVSEITHVPKALVCFIQDNRRDRIGLDTKKKLDGWIAYRDKYSEIIYKNILLRYRFESQIFIYALLQKKFDILLNSLPWVMFGAFFKFPNFIRSIISVVVIYHRNSRQRRNS